MPTLASGPETDEDLELLIRAAEAALTDSDPENDREAVNKVLRAVQKMGAKVDWGKKFIALSLETNGKVRRVEEPFRNEGDGFEATLRCARKLIKE